MSVPKVGDRAPVFATTDDSGASVTLQQHRGHWVALFFYPKDDTPG